LSKTILLRVSKPDSSTREAVVSPGTQVLDRAITVLVPAGFVTAIIAHLFPFLDSSPSFHVYDPQSLAGVQVFLAGVQMLTVSGGQSVLQALLYFGDFSCPLILASVGLVVQRRGWVGAVAALAAGALGFICLAAIPYFGGPQQWGYGYFAAEYGFLIATIASAMRLSGWLLGLGITGKPLPRRRQLPAHKWELVSSE
jgi:hypothetical protein